MIYKQRAYVLVNDWDNEEYKTAVGVDHLNCRLGKWYSGAGKEVFGEMPSFRKLDAPHSKVHGSIHRMLTLMEMDWAHDEKLQDQIMDQLKVAEEASLDVMTVIDQMVADKHPNLANRT